MNARSSVVVTGLLRIGWSMALFLLLTPPPAAAESQYSAAATGPAKATAQLDFRIVIPERIRVSTDDPSTVPPRLAPQRSIERRVDRIVITVAQP